MQSIILTLHICVCIILVILILLQSGKEGMGVIFGGGNSSVFGSTGAGGVLAKLTTLFAIIFIITSLSYTYVSSSRPSAESVILNVQIEDQGQKGEKPAMTPKKRPETPAAAPESKPATPAAEPEKSESSAASGAAQEINASKPDAQAAPEAKGENVAPDAR